jgi:hypothetical protein
MTTRPGYVWDATASEWVEIGQAAVVAPVAYQASEPSSPATGDIWIDSDDEVPSVDSTLYYRWTKTMSGGETSLSGTDDNSLALKYTPGYESVFINGVLQVRGSDYVATTGTTVTGLTALTASDVVMVESIIAYSVGDTYTQTTLDGKFSPITTTGLVLLSTTTIGSAVSSVVVSNCFSANYDNYYITVTGGVGSATGYLSLTLGATATGYYRVNVIAPYTTGTLSTFQSTNASSWFAVFPFTTNSISGFADLQNPFISKNTHFFSRGSQSDTAGEIGINSGYLANTTSYTGFTLTTSTGTITGGTIKVYGYK